MKKKVFIMVIALAIIFILPVLPASAAEPVPSTAAKEKVIIYQTNFSSNPSWVTNNPTRYYWDAQKQLYHYVVQGGTGGYAYVPVQYDNVPFTLEYDWYPIHTDKDTAFWFGLGSEEMDVTRGTNILSEFPNKKYGKIMGLQVISQNNNKLEVTSSHDSYGGPTINFDDNQTYHVIIRYNKDLQNADIKVNYIDNQTVLWGYYLNLGQDLHYMDRLFISSIGMYGSIDNSAEGYIGNLSFYTYRDIVPTTATTTPTPTTPVITKTTVPVTTVPTTTKAPLSWVTGIAALTIAGFVGIRLRKN
jgi:hypothetical protein